MSIRSKTLAILSATSLAGCLAGCGGPSPADQVVKALEGMGFRSVRYSGSDVRPTTVSLSSVTAVSPSGLPFTASDIHADRIGPGSTSLAWTRFQLVTPTLGVIQASMVEIGQVSVVGDRTRHGSIVLQDVALSGPWGTAKALRLAVSPTQAGSADIAFQRAEIAASGGLLQPFLANQSWTGFLDLKPSGSETALTMSADSAIVAMTAQATVPGAVDLAATLGRAGSAADWMQGLDLSSLVASVRILAPVDGLDLSDPKETPGMPSDGGLGRTLTGTVAPDARIPLASLAAQWKEALAGKPGPLKVDITAGR